MVANEGGANSLYLNNGSGSFVDSTQSLGTGDTASIALGDVDGDGDLDAASANISQGNRLYLNQ